MIRAGFIIDVELGDYINDIYGPDGRSDPPTGHGKFLGKTVEDYTPFGHARNGCQGNALSFIANVKIGLVAEHIEVMPGSQFGKFFKLLRGTFRAGGILPVVEYEYLRARSYLPFDGIHIQLEAFLPFNISIG